MLYKKYYFKFASPVKCFDEFITEDVVIARTEANAKKIIQREYMFAKIIYAEELPWEMAIGFTAVPNTSEENSIDTLLALSSEKS